MRYLALSLAFSVGFLAPATARAQQPDTAKVDVTLHVRSAVLGKETHFRIAFVIDARRGLQVVDTTTPFDVTGRAHGATAIIQRVPGGLDLSAQLIEGTGADTANVAAATGPLLTLNYQPALQWALRSSPAKAGKKPVH